MNERTPRSYDKTKTAEKSTYPRWAKVAAGLSAVATAAIGYNTIGHTDSHESRPQDNYSLMASENFALQQDDTVIGAADRLLDSRGIQLTHSQKSELDLSAAHATDRKDGTARITPQPGEVITLDRGEFDGDPELDYRVRITPGETIDTALTPEGLTQTEETLPDYYQDK